VSIQLDITRAELARAITEVDAARRSQDIDAAITAAVVRYYTRTQENLQDTLRQKCESLKQTLFAHFRSV
jgi:hypothetical protein